jgi:hypothetical protein
MEILSNVVLAVMVAFLLLAVCIAPSICAAMLDDNNLT